MKFLADENLGIQVPKYLQSLGIDIVAIQEIAPGANDREVLSIANKEDRILITLDKDFGNLIFKEKLIHTGVIFVRLKNQSIENKKKILAQILSSKKKFKNKFTTFKEKVRKVKN